MPRFGRAPWPRRFGGGQHEWEQEHQALLDALAPGWDDSSTTESYLELLAHALAVTFVWQLDTRLVNQGLPDKMLENLTTWEEACGLRPTAYDSATQRRRALAAKLRGLGGNTYGDIWEACRKMAPLHFVELIPIAAANQVSYWPGVNPGPPGLEWASNRAIVCVKMKKDGLTEAAFVDLRGRMALMLDALIPAWCRYVIGVGDGWLVNVGIVGQTFL